MESTKVRCEYCVNNYLEGCPNCNKGYKQKWVVTLVMILGYYDNEYEHPRLRQDEYIVEAKDEESAIRAAKQLDKTGFSIWESYASEADDE